MLPQACGFMKQCDCSTMWPVAFVNCIQNNRYSSVYKYVIYNYIYMADIDCNYHYIVLCD